MNRENKKKSFEKGYYKTHACNEVFVCKNCGREVIPEGAGSVRIGTVHVISIVPEN